MRPIFREYAAEHNKKGVTKAECVQMMARLATDECIIGKVPNVPANQYEALFDNWQETDEGLITWHYFAEGSN